MKFKLNRNFIAKRIQQWVGSGKFYEIKLFGKELTISVTVNED